MTDQKRSRKPVFFRPAFKQRAVQGGDYLQALWQRGVRFWEERWASRKVQPKKGPGETTPGSEDAEGQGGKK